MVIVPRLELGNEPGWPDLPRTPADAHATHVAFSSGLLNVQTTPEPAALAPALTAATLLLLRRGGRRR